jgi:hypothetical protein
VREAPLNGPGLRQEVVDVLARECPGVDLSAAALVNPLNAAEPDPGGEGY